jgi:nitroreductase
MLTPTEIRSVVETAIAAPSVHNSQPWLFVARPDGIDVVVDATRRLPHQDPDGRETTISCGAASLLAELAVRGLGRACEVRLVPEPDCPEVVARLLVGGDRAPSEQELRLLQAVPRRHTDRGSFADWPVPEHVLDELGAAAEAESAWLQVLSTADMLELALWQSHAQAELVRDPQAVQERGTWARHEPEPADGLPSALVPGWPAGRPAHGAVRVMPSTAADLVLVLGTDGDDPVAWARAGRALARMLLEATATGLVAAPATLALELPTVRYSLTAALALRGAPQMVLRTGYPAGLGTARAGRRPVDEVLVDAGSSGACPAPEGLSRAAPPGTARRARTGR